MSERNCFVLVQHRTESEYNDFIGKFYHFPQKYLSLLSSDNLEFVYYEPTTKKGAGVYFGYGKLGRIFEDKQVDNHYFIEINIYRVFSREVPFRDENDAPRERGPGYNPQNAVRRVLPEELDEICLDGGVTLTFTADAHLIKVLGEELIASEVVGILELVKNAYDANATFCRVRIEKVPELPAYDDSDYLFPEYTGPIILVQDDGTGMDMQTIEYGWMRPASTLKTNVKERLKKEKFRAIQEGKLGTYKSLVKELKKHHGGRLPLGEKGVGRFATHRLGRNLVIRTKTKDIDYEYVLRIDWDRFESSEEHGPLDLGSVGISLTREPPSRNYGARGSGTELIIYGGREGYALTEPIIKEINRSILKLQSPKRGPEDFKTFFECPQLIDLDETPIAEEFEPSFTFNGLIDEDGLAEFELSFNPPGSVPLPTQKIEKTGFDFRKHGDDEDTSYWLNSKESNGLKKPECGAFYLHLDIWYRASPWIDGPNKKTFTDHLDSFGGISIYRDGLNIFPADWGAEVDWLKLSKRHIKKGINVSYYNMIGSLELEQETNVELRDKTDRQGLLENAAFRDLSKLTRAIILYIENYFTGKRNEYSNLTTGLLREPKKLGDASQQSSLLAKKIAERYDIIGDPDGIVEHLGSPPSRKERLINLSKSLKSLEKSLKVMQEVQDLLTEQAGYGLAIGVAVHEIAKITSNFYTGITKLLKAGALDKKKLEDLLESSSSLKTELKRFAPFRAIRNEPPMTFNIMKSINFCHSVFERRFRKSKIDFNVDLINDFEVHARYGAVNQVLSNLMDNSCYWLITSGVTEKEIRIKVDGRNRILVVADSGPDIDESIRPYLFEPGYSLKIPPSGLGLYVCKYYMRSFRGNIYEASRKDRIDDMTGAQFVLDFSRAPEDEEA